MQGSLAEYGPDSDSRITGSMATDKCNLGISPEARPSIKRFLAAMNLSNLLKTLCLVLKRFSMLGPAMGFCEVT